MTSLGILFLFLISNPVSAQIADASFFPSMRTINPSVAHMRTSGFIGADVSKTQVNKVHDVTAGGTIGGIKTDVDFKKGTLYRAGKGPGITFEALLDQESGEKVERINTVSRGNRKITNEAKSTYYGAVLDLKYIGISYAGANYKYDYNFRIGDPPNVSAHDMTTELNYTNLKVGSAIKIKNFRLGGFILDQRSKGDYGYTYYDPSTGNKGTTEKFPTSTSAKGYGIGAGYTIPKFRMEVSLERMYANKLKLSDDFPKEVSAPSPADRLSFVGEIRISKLSLGIRTRQIKGNYVDLENIISSNLLYGELTQDDTRLENSFNFGWGDGKGFSFSAFYTQSTVNSSEKDPAFGTDEFYDAETTSKAFGANISYTY